MTRSVSLLLCVGGCVVGFGVVATGCGGTGGSDGGATDVFTAAQWAVIQTLSPLPAAPPASPTNQWADNDKAATLGQEIYFDNGYAGPLVVGDDGTNGALGMVGDVQKVSCNSCHDLAHGGVDHRATPNNVSLGVDYGKRNTPSSVNAAYYTWIGWSGSFDSIWSYATQVHEFGTFFASNRLAYVHWLYSDYKDDYDALFPVPLDPALDPTAADAARFPPSGKPKAAGAADGPWEMMASADQAIVETIMANSGKALEAFVRRLVSGNAPFDQYVAGNFGALTASAKRGLALFVGKAACNACHSGPFFTDEKFHDTGIAQTGPHVPAMDLGYFTSRTNLLASPWNGAGAFSDDKTTGAAKLGSDMPTMADQGKFRTKNLRNLSETAPYFHTGGRATLMDVVDFYNAGGDATGFAGTKDPKMVPLNLTASEESDLVEFLGTLTGDPVPSMWTTAPPD